MYHYFTRSCEKVVRLKGVISGLEEKIMHKVLRSAVCYELLCRVSYKLRFAILRTTTRVKHGFR